MKRLVWVLPVVLMLAGCGQNTDENTYVMAVKPIVTQFEQDKLTYATAYAKAKVDNSTVELRDAGSNVANDVPSLMQELKSVEIPSSMQKDNTLLFNALQDEETYMQEDVQDCNDVLDGQPMQYSTTVLQGYKNAEEQNITQFQKEVPDAFDKTLFAQLQQAVNAANNNSTSP